MLNKKTQGFTLIELLIVIAIIGILAAVLIPNLLSARQRAYDTTAQTCAKQIATAQEIFQIDNNSYAGALADLDAGVVSTCDTGWVANFGNGAGAAAGSTYSAEVKHPQGNNTFTVTPSGIN